MKMNIKNIGYHERYVNIITVLQTHTPIKIHTKNLHKNHTTTPSFK
jgi:hypothetical protein